MKVVLLAGGFGSRISEESQFKPKPMIEIGGMPILWHIMKEYAYYGHTEFIICAGYKQEYIKEWFANYFLHNSDVTFDYRNGKNEMTVHQTNMEPWKVTVVDTGYNTMTGGRIKRIQKYVGNEPFLMTYGDGVCDVEIDKLIEFHKSHGKLATLTAVKMAQDKGILDITETMSDADVKKEIKKLADQYNVQVTDGQIEQLLKLCRQLEKLDTNQLKEKLVSITNTVAKAMTAKDKVAKTVTTITEKVTGFLGSVSKFFAGLFNK